MSRKVRAARRRARRMARVEHDLSDEQWGALQAAWGGCAYCGATGAPMQRDCVLALSRGGRYTLDNVVPACRSCNTSKCNDEVTAWLRRKRLDERSFLLRHLEIRTALAPSAAAADPAVRPSAPVADGCVRPDGTGYRGRMASHEDSIEVDVPVTTAYNQWTQFEEFPRFMEGVQEIRQVTDTMTHWKVEIAGVEREFDAEITEQHPDERIAWRSVDGTTHAGVVTFHKLSDDRSKVMLQLDVDAEGLVEKAGEALGFVEHRIKGDLSRFKTFIEDRERETGAWRGDVPRD